MEPFCIIVVVESSSLSDWLMRVNGFTNSVPPEVQKELRTWIQPVHSMGQHTGSVEGLLLLSCRISYFHTNYAERLSS